MISNAWAGFKPAPTREGLGGDALLRLAFEALFCGVGDGIGVFEEDADSVDQGVVLPADVGESVGDPERARNSGVYLGRSDLANLYIRARGVESRYQIVIEIVGLVVRRGGKRQILRNADNLFDALEKGRRKLVVVGVVS